MSRLDIDVIELQYEHMLSSFELTDKFSVDKRIRLFLNYVKSLDEIRGFDYPMNLYPVMMDILNHPEEFGSNYNNRNSVGGVVTIVSSIVDDVEGVTFTVTDNTNEIFMFGYYYNLKSRELELFVRDELIDLAGELN